MPQTKNLCDEFIILFALVEREAERAQTLSQPCLVVEHVDHGYATRF